MGGNSVSEDEIIRRKLLIDGEGMGDERRLELLMRSFIKWAGQEDGDDEHCSTSLAALENAVDGCLKSMIKSHKVLAMNEAELAQYNELYAQIGDEIRRTEEQIEREKERLVNVKQIRANKEHYNTMAKVISKEKDRSETTRELEKAERGMVELQSRKEALAKRIEQHHRQFQVLLSAVHQLQQLNNNSGKDEQNATKRGSGSGAVNSGTGGVGGGGDLFPMDNDGDEDEDDDDDEDIALLEEGEMEDGTLDTSSHASVPAASRPAAVDARSAEMSGEDTTQDTLEGSLVAMPTPTD